MSKTKKLSPFQINAIKVLRQNGMSFDGISSGLGVSVGVAHKYGSPIIKLPKNQRKDPWEVLITLQGLPTLESPELGSYKKAIKEKQSWIDNHIPGERFIGPLSMFSLDELCEMMVEPTGYISELGQTDWYDYYIAPMTFRGVSTTLNNTQILLNNFFDTHKHAMGIIFREGGKTVLAEGRLTRHINEKPENNYAIQSENVERSMERLMVVRNHLMGNPRLIADYGYLPLDRDYKRIKGAWKNNQITVKRNLIQTDPTLKAVSWKDARLLGGHFHGILFDDPWSSKLEENNEKNKEKWFRWYDSTLIGCMEHDSWQHIICTFKGLYDIYRDLIDRDIFSVYKQPAIWEFPTDYEYIKNEAGKIIGVDVRSDDWHISDDGNGRFTIEGFLMKKAQIPDSAFQMEWQLNPLPKKGRLFDWDDVIFFDYTEMPKEDIKKMRVIAAMDLAFGKSDRAHFTALAIVGYLKGEYYLIDLYMKKGTSKVDKAKMIRLAKMDYPTMRRVYIEADFHQAAYIEDLKALVPKIKIDEVLSRHEEKVLKKEDIGKLSPKHVRIYSQIDEIVESGHFWINERMKNKGEFEREFKEFPRSLYDDGIDATGSGMSKLKKSRIKLWGASG